MNKQIGYIGLGKMGANMVERLLEKGWQVTAYDPNQESVDNISTKGAKGVSTLDELIKYVEAPRTIWLMVPHMVVDKVLEELIPLLREGDTVIDGGNSPYAESVRRANDLESRDIRWLDAGISGGPGGARNGACAMVGGEKDIFEEYEELFKDISAPEAYGYMGLAGAGHFVKMVHNGIEYGMMQAIAEGFDIMKKTELYDFNLKDISRVYNNRSVIESRLVGWLKRAYDQHGQDLADISGSAAASGEGQWTVDEAHRLGIPDTVIHSALRARELSQDKPSYQGKVVQALRNQFGGHEIKE